MIHLGKPSVELSRVCILQLCRIKLQALWTLPVAFLSGDFPWKSASQHPLALVVDLGKLRIADFGVPSAKLGKCNKRIFLWLGWGKSQCFFIKPGFVSQFLAWFSRRDRTRWFFFKLFALWVRYDGPLQALVWLIQGPACLWSYAWMVSYDCWVDPFEDKVHSLNLATSAEYLMPSKVSCRLMSSLVEIGPQIVMSSSIKMIPVKTEVHGPGV